MMEGQMKVHSSQNISGASQQKIAAAFTWTTEVDGIKKKKKKKTPQEAIKNWLHAARLA